jgi:hypothetical protein
VDFSLSPEQDAFLESVHAFVRERVAPAAARIDETGVFPRALVDEAARLSLAGMMISKEFGAGTMPSCTGDGNGGRAVGSATLAVILSVNNLAGRRAPARPRTRRRKIAGCGRSPRAGRSARLRYRKPRPDRTPRISRQSRGRRRRHVISRHESGANAEAADGAVVFARLSRIGAQASRRCSCASSSGHSRRLSDSLASRTRLHGPDVRRGRARRGGAPRRRGKGFGTRRKR